MRLLFLTTLATALALTAPLTRASNLLTYSFNGTLSPTTQGGVTGSGFLATGGSNAVVGIGNGGNTQQSNNGTYGYILITKSSTSASNAVNNAQFAQFSVTPPAKNGVQLGQIQIVAARGGNSSPRGLVLRWSLDNYQSNIGQLNVTTTWPTTRTYVFNVGTFAGDTVTFRLYAFAQEISQAQPSIRFDNLILTGSPIIYPPTVTPASTNITTSKASYTIRGSAYSSQGIARVEVARTSSSAVYSGANGTTNWNYNATSLHFGKNVFYVRSVSKTGQYSTPVRVTITRSNSPTPVGPTPTPSSTP